MEAPVQLLPAMFGFGSGWHWIIILVVVLLLFGRRIPAMLRSLGTGVREFREGMEKDGDEQPPAPPKA